MKWEFGKRFVQDTSGAAFVYVAVAMFGMVGFTGLAIDVGHWYTTQRSAQVATDAAAVAGAFEAMWGGETTDVVAAAEDQAAANGFPAALVTVNIPPSSGPNTGDTKAVEVIIQSPTAGLFSSIMGVSEIDIASRSVASLVSGSPACMVALRPNGTAIDLNSNSHVTANGCSVHSNSNSGDAINTNGGSSMTAEEISVVGGTVGSGISPAADTGADVRPDPLSYLQPPAIGSCTNPGRDYELTEPIGPGVYCGDHVFKNGAVVTFTGGTYIFTGSKFEVDSGATIKTNPGDGVTLYFASGLLFTLNSDSTANLEAPAIGDYPGILIYSESSEVHMINSQSSSIFEGTVYIPNGKVLINSGSSSLSGNASFSAFVAYEFEINSDSTLVLNSDYTTSSVPSVPTLGAQKVAIFE